MGTKLTCYLTLQFLICCLQSTQRHRACLHATAGGPAASTSSASLKSARLRCGHTTAMRNQSHYTHHPGLVNACVQHRQVGKASKLYCIAPTSEGALPAPSVDAKRGENFGSARQLRQLKLLVKFSTCAYYWQRLPWDTIGSEFF